jgi:hypothetical protein
MEGNFEEKWKKEVSIYNDRLTWINEWSPLEEEYEEEISNITNDFWPNRGLRGHENYLIRLEAFRALNYAIRNGKLGVTISKAFIINWNCGVFEILSLFVRFLFEIWGATHYAKNLLKKMKESEDPLLFSKKFQRLYCGARSEVEDPWGRIVTEKSVNVMDFIRSLEDIYPDAERTYNFLCESCHPNDFMIMYWTMAGPFLSNFENESFSLQGHKLINDTLFAMEKALKGLRLDIKETIELSAQISKTYQLGNT